MKSIFLTALFFPMLVQAQAPRPASIQTSATASISIAPDEARLEIGVISQAPTASAAAAHNAAQLQSALDKLKAAAGPGAEVKTVSYSLSPNYTDPRNGTRLLKGFTANNLVEVTTDDLPSVAKIIDAATQSGANEVQAIQFTVKDASRARAEALGKAAMTARADADAMARAMGLKLGKVIYLDQGSAMPIRPFAAMQRVATSIEPPQAIDVQATVTLTVALEQ